VAAKKKAKKVAKKPVEVRTKPIRNPGGNSTKSKARHYVRDGSPFRPRAEILPADVYNLAKLQCTHEEIAGFLGVHPATLRRRFHEEKALVDAYEGGVQYGRVSLRRLQFAGAAKGGPGSAALLIWLGKQYLGQTEKSVTANVDARDWASAVKEALQTAQTEEKPEEAPEHYEY
jgi:hypothetical protein